MKKALYLLLLPLIFVTAYSQEDYNITIEQVESHSLIGIMDSTTSPDQIKAKLEDCFGAVINFVFENGHQPADSPVAITKEFSPEKWVFIAGLPVTSELDDIKTHTRIIKLKTYEGQAVRLIYKGSYEQIEPAYTAIFKYIEDNGLTIAGDSWEAYINDPNNVSPEELVTHIYVPVQ